MVLWVPDTDSYWFYIIGFVGLGTCLNGIVADNRWNYIFPSRVNAVWGRFSFGKWRILPGWDFFATTTALTAARVEWTAASRTSLSERKLASRSLRSAVPEKEVSQSRNHSFFRLSVYCLGEITTIIAMCLWFQSYLLVFCQFWLIWGFYGQCDGMITLRGSIVVLPGFICSRWCWCWYGGLEYMRTRTRYGEEQGCQIPSRWWQAGILLFV